VPAAARPTSNNIVSNRAHAWEQELFKQRKRLADAQRKLQARETKAARNDERIATDKIAALVGKLSSLRSEQLRPEDSRIFPKKYFVPLIVTRAAPADPSDALSVPLAGQALQLRRPFRWHL
jgi:DNA-binding protein H-NS